MTTGSQHSILASIRTPVVSKLGWKKTMLACGVASTLLYFGMDVIATLLYDGYSYSDQTISELSAIDAPTRSFWIPLAFLYSLLVIGGGIGIWMSAGQRRSLRVVAGCVSLIGVIGLIAWPFAPMHQREVLAAGGATFSDTMHLILGSVDTLLFTLIMAAGSTAFGKGFRFYSFATIFFVLLFGALTGMGASKVEANDPTPWIGITERIAVFGSMVWIAMLSFLLLRAGGQKGEPK